MAPVSKLPLTDAGREQIKLRATFLNGIAIATFAVGTLTTLARALLDISEGHAGLAVGITFSLVCFVISWAIHIVAYRHLRELDR